MVRIFFFLPGINFFYKKFIYKSNYLIKKKIFYKKFVYKSNYLILKIYIKMGFIKLIKNKYIIFIIFN